MIIRRATQNDIKDLNWLLTLLIRAEKQYDNNINSNFIVTNMYENYIEDSNRYIIVAEENNEIIGYLYGYIDHNDPTIINKKSILDALYIKEEYRGKKIANQLIENFKIWSITNNAYIIEVTVCSDNKIAKHLYNKHNFSTVKETLICKIK